MSDYNQKLVKIQNVFEKVISVGMFYGDHNDSSRFMCHALERSLGHGYITQEEYDLAVEDIRDVLHTAQTLTGLRVSSAIRDAIESCVNLKILPKSYHQYIIDRKPLYQNWATLRPFKVKNHPGTRANDLQVRTRQPRPLMNLWKWFSMRSSGTFAEWRTITWNRRFTMMRLMSMMGS